MADNKKKIRVLLAQFPLETHTKGLLTVAAILRDAGMEVILMGNARPEEIARAALEEYVDAVGISSYCGGEVVLAEKLMQAAHNEGIRKHAVFVLGGIFPPQSAARLKKLGFTAVFPPSSSNAVIIGGIKKGVAARRKKNG
jgi:methylmalonyl-CoA mutase C-terminal domain/subunit